MAWQLRALPSHSKLPSRQHRAEGQIAESRALILDTARTGAVKIETVLLIFLSARRLQCLFHDPVWFLLCDRAGTPAYFRRVSQPRMKDEYTPCHCQCARTSTLVAIKVRLYAYRGTGGMKAYKEAAI